tara:strand:- start:915 stop:1769 length:855 start_codon:yes stop_codon:yes gene_type:complete
MNIALTGSSGLIGSMLVDDLKKAGHKVLCISSSHSFHKENIYSYEEVISKKISLKVDCVLHLASINSNLHESEISDELSLSQKAIDSMIALDCKKIIFFSSIKVYGSNSFENKEFTEESILKPKCSYGIAKKRCEDLIIKEALIENFNYLILRLPPLLLSHSKSNLGKLFLVIKKGLPMPSFHIGDNNKRSFLSYEYLVSALDKVLTNQTRIENEIFNLADPSPISTNVLLKKIGEILNKKTRIIYFPNFIFHLMIRVNRLQLILCRIYGNFNISSEKFRKSFF